MSGTQCAIIISMLLTLSFTVVYLFITFERKLNIELKKLENLKGSVEHENTI